MKKIILITILLFFSGVVTSLAQDKTVRVVSLSWPPYYGQYLPDYGLSGKIVAAAFKKQGWDVNFYVRAWVQCLEMLKKGEFEAVPNAYFTEERAQIYHYSDPYLDCPIVFFKKKDQDISWKTYEDLKDYRIGVVRGYANPEAFDKADFLTKRVARDPVLNFKKLLLKQVDLIVSEKFVGTHIMNTKLPEHEKGLFEPISPPLDTIKLYVLFSKKVPGIQAKIDAFNTGLKQIKNDGTIERIVAEYGFRE